MRDNGINNRMAQERKILGPTAWILYSSALWALLTIPISIGICLMFQVAPNLFKEPNQYSVLIGLVIGIILAISIGAFYARIAQKRLG